MAELNIQRNAHVVASDGELGRVTHVVVHNETREVTDLVVKHGLREFTVPMSAVARVEGDRIAVAGPAAGYRTAPVFSRQQYHSVDEGRALQEGDPGATHGGATLVDAEDDAVDVERTPAAASGPRTWETDAADPYRIQLREEHLRVVKQPERAGTVAVGKRVTEQTETLTVPVREDRLVIERLPGSGEVVESVIGTEEPETIVVALMKERVSLVKEAVVIEEVNIRKDSVQRDETVEATVRREELVVDDERGFVVPRT